MVVKLSDEQYNALALARAVGPVYVRNPAGNSSYVLVPSDTYERIRSLIGAG